MSRLISRRAFCQLPVNRNIYEGFSTQARFESHTRFFRRRKSKKKKGLPDREELHEQLAGMLNARVLQLSSSTGKQMQPLEHEISHNVTRLKKDNLRLGLQSTESPKQTGFHNLHRLGHESVKGDKKQTRNHSSKDLQDLNVNRLDHRTESNYTKYQNQSDHQNSNRSSSTRELSASDALVYLDTLPEKQGHVDSSASKNRRFSGKGQTSTNKHKSVIKSAEISRELNELDAASGNLKGVLGFNKMSVNAPRDKMFDRKSVILNDYPRKIKPVKGEMDVADGIRSNFQEHKHASVFKVEPGWRKGSKKKRLKVALNEMYGRRNEDIQMKKESLKMTRDRQKKKSLFELYHRGSSSKPELQVTEFREGLEAAKRMFIYKPETKSVAESKDNDQLIDVFFEKPEKEVENPESLNEIGETLATKPEVEEQYETLDLPDAEWAVIKAIRKKRKSTPQVLSMEEMSKLEMLQDPFHEDTRIMDDLLVGNAAAADWTLDDYIPIEGFLTERAQKERDERDKKREKDEMHAQTVDEVVEHTKLALFNKDLQSYVEACVYSGITMRALKDVRMYRGLNRKNYKINDIRIYNTLLRGLSKEFAELDLVREVFSYLKEDGLQPSLETYMLCLSCIGKTSDYDLMIASFIVKDMIKQGLDVKDIFNQCTFLHNERHIVYKMLTKVIPGYEPNPPEVAVKYGGPLVEPLSELLPKDEMVDVNPFTCGMAKDEIMNAAEEQFCRELDGYTVVNSVFKTRSKIDAQKREAIKETQESWRRNIKKAFLLRKSMLRTKAYATHGINMYPFFCLFPDDDYVDIFCKELQTWALFTQMFSLACSYLRSSIVQKVRQRLRIQQMIEVDVFPKLHKAYSSYVTHLTDPNESIQTQRECWQKITQRFTDGNSMVKPSVDWSESVRSAIGDIFFDIMMNNTEFNVNMFSDKPKKLSKAFFIVERTRDGRRNVEVKPHPMISSLMNAQTDMIMPTDKLPSLCPPVPYTTPGQGGDFINSVNVIRWCTPHQVQLFKDNTAETGPVLDSLNVMSTYAWKVNKPVLDVILKVFKEGGDVNLDIPILPDRLPKPDRPDPSVPREHIKAYNKKMFSYKKSMSEAVSLWWSALYKLSIANDLRDKTFWLPMNIDFRGRTYPVAPHLSNQNPDFVKALMLFGKGKALGEVGFDWLKLHLINLTELKKRDSLEERLAYADEVMPQILDSAENPLKGDKWWMESENPWQTLAACMEVAAATRSGDPNQYVSDFPIHQDGSCNGLQHYAALGRDVTGAQSVNLKSYATTPADIYSDVVDLVRKEIAYDIDNTTGDAVIAELCQPFLERKVIKQTIMTTVYGVTMFGAKLQIQRQLGYKDFPEEHILVASRYLAQKTFQCLNNLFTSARQIQNWFDQCSVAIGRSGHSVEWKTPLNFVCIQPYFRSKPQPPNMPDKVYNYLITKTYSLRVADVHKQKNGFAPNFIHSLDSTHMMLTSLYCYRKGLTYSSVHDSYWTHACDVDEMNRITREQFIALHKQPILQNLSQYFVDRAIERDDLSAEQYAKLNNIFCAVPERGDFDLNDIMKSTYFFS